MLFKGNILDQSFPTFKQSGRVEVLDSETRAVLSQSLRQLGVRSQAAQSGRQGFWVARVHNKPTVRLTDELAADAGRVDRGDNGATRCHIGDQLARRDAGKHVRSLG